MALQNISISNIKRTCGFTLLEMLIVLALVSSIASLTLFFGIGEYMQQSGETEVARLRTTLERVRNKALYGVDGLPHGVVLAPGSYAGYVVFTGVSYEASNPATREYVGFTYPLQFVGEGVSEIIFSTLAGTTTPTTITISDSGRETTHVISITSEGRMY